MAVQKSKKSHSKSASRRANQSIEVKSIVSESADGIHHLSHKSYKNPQGDYVYKGIIVKKGKKAV